MAGLRSPSHVCLAGLAGGDGTALVLITHERVDRHEVEDVLLRRWPEVLVKVPEQEQPAVTMSPSDAAEPGQRRRGVEPLRFVNMPQHYRRAAASPVMEQMPVIV